MAADRLVLPPLHAIVDDSTCLRAGLDPGAVAEAYLESGVRWLQLRAKGAGGRLCLSWARRIAARARATGAHFVVNDRADIARLVSAGVHVGQDDLPALAARSIVGEHALIGLSTHTLEQVERSLTLPVSYIAIGPVFQTQTKDTGYQAVGLSLVRQVASLVGGSLPIVAIGGITLDRAPAVLEAGATAVAVIGDLMLPDPRARAAEWVEKMGSGIISALRESRS
ncbi:MAG: thiamine phosphate synthase [Vicinamibacterales bacterium]